MPNVFLLSVIGTMPKSHYNSLGGVHISGFPVHSDLTSTNFLTFKALGKYFLKVNISF